MSAQLDILCTGAVKSYITIRRSRVTCFSYLPEFMEQKKLADE